MSKQGHICKNCGYEGVGNYCATCGEKYRAAKITLPSMVHQVVHFFTHVDRGFGYTVKELATHPGEMQREYIDGLRSRHQKPFSFFFVCGTICGLAFYLISVANGKLHGNIDTLEEDFFRHYFVLVQACMLPFYAFVLWIVFKRSKYNYAELLVLMLYNLGFVFLILIPINLLNLLPYNFDVRYVEVVFLLIYNTLTNIRFFIRMPKWVTVVLTIINLAICYAASQVVIEIAKRILL